MKTVSTLFGEIEIVTAAARKETRLAERRRKQKQAYDATSEAWKASTHRIAVDEFLTDHETFVFEELSTYYNDQAKLRHLPATVNGKAFAGLRTRLVNEGSIELIPGEMRTRSNGQDGKVYRSNLCRNSISTERS